MAGDVGALELAREGHEHPQGTAREPPYPESMMAQVPRGSGVYCPHEETQPLTQAAVQIACASGFVGCVQMWLQHWLPRSQYDSRVRQAWS